MTFTNEHTELEIFAEENPPKRVNRPEACGLRHLAFCVESVEQTVKELAEVGIECEPIRVDDYTDKKMTFFHDPDGMNQKCQRRCRTPLKSTEKHKTIRKRTGSSWRTKMPKYYGYKIAGYYPYQMLP